ncbi:MAG: tyrosine--tRNA ligase [Kiritimatiellae bacterium]|nr:tyrosine--tRNA ligase [Kiritimatiellia bacterium]MBR3777421.1 tyrosine--tRNA ligase [Kiritimatiellia bacterium]
MNLIEELKERGLVEALTDPEIGKMLEKPTTLYCGFDPSAKSLQAGNLVSIMVLKRFQQAGHRVIALVGGATGLIGDPSGKSAERNMLTLEQVEENKRGIRENLSRILDFDGPNAAVMVDNYDWYKGTSAIEFLRDIAINFRVPQMLSKESVKKRLEASEGALTFTEFSYQILQGNDFLHLYDNYGCMLEVGGADQWGNITAGTDLVHRMRGKTAYGLTFPLLLDSAGRKFGKSEGNALFMNAEMTSVYDWYQYFLRAADADVIRYLKVFSLKSLDEIAALEAEMKANPEARIPQKALAEELTRLVHGEAGLQTALGATKTLFGGDVSGKSAAELSQIFKDVKSAELPAAEIVGKSVYAVAAAAGMFKSNGEARRMAAQGGLSLNGAKVDDKRIFESSDLIDGELAVLRQGKKANFLLRAKN